MRFGFRVVGWLKVSQGDKLEVQLCCKVSLLKEFFTILYAFK